jgi:hypothetical protein
MLRDMFRHFRKKYLLEIDVEIVINKLYVNYIFTNGLSEERIR